MLTSPPTRFFAFGLLLLLAPPMCAPTAASPPTIERDVTYGFKGGTPLILDVLKPSRPNGAGILAIQSAGWYSARRDPAIFVPNSLSLLNRGFTVFLIWHANPPQSKVPDAIADVRRAARYIHANASRWNIDPNRLGAVGGSAGGHLSLMLATTADKGNPNASDPIERHSNRIAAVVSINAPTDLRGWTTKPPEAITKIAILKAPLSFDAALESDCSPIVHVDPSDAQILLLHGQKDDLISVNHALHMIATMRERRAPGDIVVLKNSTHSVAAQDANAVATATVNWFVKHLGKSK
ncbi:hypothetical protein FEM03_22985 [Phragmitibacter flavus]|uniref:BD-FAE-like domain-containing protein n=1 Tax=Phragmitibacter flavus TaxID=2576071 RepID=A0A5R8K7Q6_9BACT|nr:prolyl oligopeptidase family serine peptidase [Phragmitibacter flavus]TLD68372.1 hypothetical protein FEM03_22985 [Phragmitibacter flavus]